MSIGLGSYLTAYFGCTFLEFIQITKMQVQLDLDVDRGNNPPAADYSLDSQRSSCVWASTTQSWSCRSWESQTGQQWSCCRCYHGVSFWTLHYHHGCTSDHSCVLLCTRMQHSKIPARGCWRLWLLLWSLSIGCPNNRRHLRRAARKAVQAKD